MTTTLFHNARIMTPRDTGRPLCGAAAGDLLDLPQGALLVREGQILAVGPEAELRARPDAFDALDVDLGGGCVVPGFVDPHTHMCFAARREQEFGLRLAGATYLEILEKGGGILSSMRALRAAADEDILAVMLASAKAALRHGTTTLEIKSGYGLDCDSELRMLRLIAEVHKLLPLDVVPTFMGAHAIPTEHKATPEAYVESIINEMLPAVKKQGIARYCDVFCELNVFSIEQSRRILLAAKEYGLGLKIHADEVNELGGAALAAEVSAVSAEHLLAASDTGLARMAESGVIAVLLPGTAYSLRKPYARAKAMLEYGVPVALATDCNPGSCFCESMPFIMGLAIMNMGLTPEQALCAGTLNSAYAIGMQHSAGSLEAGKNADFLVLDGESPAVLAYHAGMNPVAKVYKKGTLVAGASIICN